MAILFVIIYFALPLILIFAYRYMFLFLSIITGYKEGVREWGNLCEKPPPFWDAQDVQHYYKHERE